MKNVKKVCIVFKGKGCINETLDHALHFKGGITKVNYEIVK